MKKITKYECQYCGDIFDSQPECEEHEAQHKYEKIALSHIHLFDRFHEKVYYNGDNSSVYSIVADSQDAIDYALENIIELDLEDVDDWSPGEILQYNHDTDRWENLTRRIGLMTDICNAILSQIQESS